MFSMGDDKPEYERPTRMFYGGVQFMDVDYKGDQSVSNSGLFQFEGPVIRLGYRSQMLDFSLASGGSITGIEEVSYFDIGGSFEFGLPIIQSKHFGLQVPFRISSGYTVMTNSKAVASSYNRFNFGNLNAGLGLKLLIRPQQNIRVHLGAVPSYGFSFATGGFFGGGLGAIPAEGRIYFDGLFDKLGLSLGYQYNYRSYNVDSEVYDYQIKGHLLELGITF